MNVSKSDAVKYLLFAALGCVLTLAGQHLAGNDTPNNVAGLGTSHFSTRATGGPLCQTYANDNNASVCLTPGTSTSTTSQPTTSTTVKPTTTTRPTTTTPTTTTTTTIPPSPTIGAPADAGLTVATTTLQAWTGPTTITPTTAGVINGAITGYLFNSGPIRVSGNVTFTNDKFAFQSYWHIIVGGTSLPGPKFSHIEIDGLNCTTACTSPNSNTDDDGITNSSRDNGMTQGVSVSSFTLDHSYLHNLVNGMRLDSGATVTNTRIDHLWVYGGSHTDGSEIYCGHGILIDHSTIDATAATGQSKSATNSATEQQGDAASGGFCPVSDVTWSNDILGGGGATWRIDDAKVTGEVLNNVQVIAGTFEWFAYSTSPNIAGVKSWTNVSVVDIGKGTLTVVPAPSGSGSWNYGCGVRVSCN